MFSEIYNKNKYKLYINYVLSKYNKNKLKVETMYHVIQNCNSKLLNKEVGKFNLTTMKKTINRFQHLYENFYQTKMIK